MGNPVTAHLLGEALFLQYQPISGMYLRTVLAQVAGLVAVTWVIWSQWVPLQVARQSPARLIGSALVYGLFAWVWASGLLVDIPCRLGGRFSPAAARVLKRVVAGRVVCAGRSAFVDADACRHGGWTPAG